MASTFCLYRGQLLGPIDVVRSVLFVMSRIAAGTTHMPSAPVGTVSLATVARLVVLSRKLKPCTKRALLRRRLGVWWRRLTDLPMYLPTLITPSEWPAHARSLLRRQMLAELAKGRPAVRYVYLGQIRVVPGP